MNAVNFTRKIHELLDLKGDTEFQETDASIRKNTEFKSANAWTLVFAIFIASVGLNVNSTAVIIGAMLVSPLMGPIVGAGYSLGIIDFTLLKRSLVNLSIAVVISLITSTIYFIISPLSEAQSELLSRVSPTFYDVLIAAFGGAAGIVAMSRKEKSNAIPGVAIATALMPPLCTAGYGIANLNFNYFAGAMYLFIINSVFICISTYIFIRLLKFSKVKYNTEAEQNKIDRWIMVGASVVIIPSLILAWLLMVQTKFKSNAAEFVKREFKSQSSFILEKDFSYRWNDQKITLTTVGDSITEAEIEDLKSRMRFYGLNPESLKLKQLSIDDRINNKLEQNQSAKSESGILQAKIQQLEKEIIASKDEQQLRETIQNEIKSFSPKISEIIKDGNSISVIWQSKPSKNELITLTNFLKVRLKIEGLRIQHLNRLPE